MTTITVQCPTCPVCSPAPVQTKHVASPPATTFTKKINPDDSNKIIKQIQSGFTPPTFTKQINPDDSNKIIKQIQSGFTPPTFTKKINPDSNHAKRKIHSGSTYDTASLVFASKQTQKQYCEDKRNGCNFDGPLMYFISNDAQNKYCTKHKCIQDPVFGHTIIPRSGGVKKELAMVLPGTRFRFIKNHPMKCYLSGALLKKGSDAQSVTVKFEINENRKKEKRIVYGGQATKYYYNKFTASGPGGGCNGTFRLNGDHWGHPEGSVPWLSHKWVIDGKNEIHCREEGATPKIVSRAVDRITYKCEMSWMILKKPKEGPARVI